MDLTKSFDINMNTKAEKMPQKDLKLMSEKESEIFKIEPCNS